MASLASVLPELRNELNVKWLETEQSPLMCLGEGAFSAASSHYRVEAERELARRMAELRELLERILARLQVPLC